MIILPAVLRPPTALLVVLLTLGLAACGSGDDAAERSSPPETTQEPAPQTPTAEKQPAARGPAEGCKGVATPDAGPRKARKPKRPLAKGSRWVVRLETSCGTIDITLDTRRAPKTSASVAALVRSGFYDDTTFHRIAHGFVIQGGDPLGTGTGGPGYKVTEAPPKSLRYTRGVVAMAKTPQEAPGTSGSQFYIVTGKDTGLPAEYALVGRVTRGMKVALRIDGADTGGAPDGPPSSPVVIEKAKLLRR